ncbi:MAG: family 20 glycosylhydrolase, partial [Flavobacteriaceae bacterium]|nr:family 20 glycosylhydrolase [Flavobacteriaceae bacterium]
MKNSITIFLIILIIGCNENPMQISHTPQNKIIPTPKEIKYLSNKKCLKLPKNIKVYSSDASLRPIVTIFVEQLNLLGLEHQLLFDKKTNATISIILDKTLKTEEYQINIDQSVILSGGSSKAISSAMTSLLHLIEKKDDHTLLPIVKIRDHPDASYRGLMIDLARRWHTTETLKKLIDLSAFYKLNYMQLHLTDDQSFTFPSNAYPKLATKDRHYSKEELVDLVNYAEQRGITLIPEIEIPGHSRKFIETYPEIFSPKLKKWGKNMWGGDAFNNVINIGNEKVYSALNVILDEVIEIFHTSPYIHIGADEATIDNLEGDPLAEAMMKKENLEGNVHELYRHFIVRMNDMVKSKNKTMCIWEGFKREGKVQIPKDIIVFEFESLYNLPNHLVEDGYTLVNTSWVPLYVVGTGIEGGWIPRKWEPKKIYSWNMWQWENFYHKSPASKKPIQLDKTPLVIGAQMCAWEQTDDGEIPSLRRRVPTFVERIWNTDYKLPYEEFYTNLDKTDNRLSAIINNSEQDSLLVGYNIVDDGNGLPI